MSSASPLEDGEVHEAKGQGAKLLLVLVRDVLLLLHLPLQSLQSVTVAGNNKLQAADILFHVPDKGPKVLKGKLNGPKGLKLLNNHIKLGLRSNFSC